MKKVLLSAILLGAMMLIASFAGAQQRPDEPTNTGATHQVVTSAQGFTVTAPVALVPGAPTTGTATSGLAYTMTDYTGSLPNKDEFLVAVTVYNTPTLDASSLQLAIDAIVARPDTKILAQADTAVSGLPAKKVIFSVDKDTLRVGYLNTIRGNVLYQFMFATNPATPSDMDGVDTFFRSASTQ